MINIRTVRISGLTTTTATLQMENEFLQSECDLVLKTIESFKAYRTYFISKVNDLKENILTLPIGQMNLLHKIKYQDFINEYEKCVDENSKFIHSMLLNHDFSHYGINNSDNSISEESNNLNRLRFNDIDKVRTVLKQFVRDWSVDGEMERKDCYSPVLNEIDRLFPKNNRGSISVLVPGAGLGRLAWELAAMGFKCQGNEFSLHMLIPSYFIINTCSKVNEYVIYPWVSQSKNVISRQDQFAPCLIPDVDPSNISEDMGSFSMAAGDFLDVYTRPEEWDCVTTVFFIDTAHNLIDYLENIHLILKPGGYWINFGPLLYHFADIPGEVSFEFSYEEVRSLAKAIGFDLIKEETGHRCGYNQNLRSMMMYEFNCVFSVWRKLE